MTPASRFKRVLLPHPDGPEIKRLFPGLIENDRLVKSGGCPGQANSRCLTSIAREWGELVT